MRQWWDNAHDLTLGMGTELMKPPTVHAVLLRTKSASFPEKMDVLHAVPCFLSLLPSMAQWVLRQGCKQDSVLNIRLKKQWCQPLFKFLPSEFFYWLLLSVSGSVFFFSFPAETSNQSKTKILFSRKTVRLKAEKIWIFPHVKLKNKIYFTLSLIELR